MIQRFKFNRNKSGDIFANRVCVEPIFHFMTIGSIQQRKDKFVKITIGSHSIKVDVSKSRRDVIIDCRGRDVLIDSFVSLFEGCFPSIPLYSECEVEIEFPEYCVFDGMFEMCALDLTKRTTDE